MSQHNRVYAAIVETWGPRCSDFAPHCPCCEAWAEYDRLNNGLKFALSGGCARDQGTTQYCAEAAAKDNIIRRMMLKMERWRGALVNIAQGKGDPVAVACAALELDND